MAPPTLRTLRVDFCRSLLPLLVCAIVRLVSATSTATSGLIDLLDAAANARDGGLLSSMAVGSTANEGQLPDEYVGPVVFLPKGPWDIDNPWRSSDGSRCAEV